MAGRRRIYGSSSLPRYRVKMFDYISRGGRVPMQLAMEAIDAMGDAWSGGFFSYKVDRDDVIAQAFEKHPEIPHMYAGLAKGLLMKIMKLKRVKGMPYNDALEHVRRELGLVEEDPVVRLLTTAVEILTEVEAKRGTSPEKA